MIPWTIPGDNMARAAAPDVRSHPAAAPPPAGWRRADGVRRAGAPRALRAAAALLGLAAIGGYLGVALARLGYPFPLEVLESNSLVEVHRILTGQPLYAAPTVGYVPDGYPPLYFAVSAAAASVLGQSYLPLRLVSLVSSLACFAIVARLVQRETASAAAGHGRRGAAGRDLFRHRHLVRRRPGRLAVPRAQRRRPLPGAMGAQPRRQRSWLACCSRPRS